jgi:hypothetical protein
VWLGLATSKWHAWKHCYGKANEHIAWIPRDHWLEDAEKRAILDFHELFPLEGYRRLTYMMLDQDIVACSPSSVYRVLKQAGLLDRHKPKSSSKGKGFVQPLRPHEHWHVDVSYINIAGTFYYLGSLFDGCSRFIVHWELREAMTEADVEQIIQQLVEQKVLGADGTQASVQSLEQALAPVREEFEQSGMTDDDLGAQVEDVREKIWSGETDSESLITAPRPGVVCQCP